MEDTKRQLLRHTLATLAYRGGKAMRGAPDGFAEFRAVGECRTPAEILAHVGDLLEWALSSAKGKQEWRQSPALPWPEGEKRFFAALEAFDSYLGSDQELKFPEEKLLQGPIADALTHIGQISLLRRLAGSPVRAENYVAAQITTGRVGADQADPVREF
jgi:hypothetical protein